MFRLRFRVICLGLGLSSGSKALEAGLFGPGGIRAFSRAQ